MKEKNFNISITDYIGKVGDGISVLLSMKVGTKLYELIYWFNKELDYRIIAEEQFYNDYKIASMYEFTKIKELVAYIDIFILPPREDIFKEFGIE